MLFHLPVYSLADSHTCPDWRSNLQPWRNGMTLQPTERPGQGLPFFLLASSPLCFLDVQALKSMFSTQESSGLHQGSLVLCGPDTHSRQSAGAIVVLTSCVPPLSGITGLGWLLSTVLKAAVTYILASLGVVLGSMLNPVPATPSGLEAEVLGINFT